MDNNIALQIHNAKNRLHKLQELNNRFLSHLSGHPDAEHLPAHCKVDEGAVVVDCFGHRASASPRAVRAGNGTFAMEYVFYAKQAEEDLELWRFYLIANGRLDETLEGGRTICDWNTTIVADYVCQPLLQAALNSSLFEPAGGGVAS